MASPELLLRTLLSKFPVSCWSHQCWFTNWALNTKGEEKLKRLTTQIGRGQVNAQRTYSHGLSWAPAHWLLKVHQFSSVQSLSCVRLCNPWTAAPQASLSITNSRSLLKLMSIKSVMPSNHLILCRPLLLLPSIFPSIRVFRREALKGLRLS